MKKILLVDHRLTDFYNIVSISTGTIETLIVTSDLEKERVLKDYPNIEVYTDKDIVNWTNTFVSKEEIDNFTSTQLKVERYLNRFWVSPSALIISKYYSALAFWLWLFRTHKYDVLFVYGVEHGAPADTIPIDLAKSLSIKTFIVESHYSANGINLCAIKDCNADKYVNIDGLDCIKRIDLEDLYFSAKSYNSSPYYPELKISNKVLRACAKLLVSINYIYSALIHYIHNEKVDKFKDKRKFVDFCWRHYNDLKVSITELYDKNNENFFLNGMPVTPNKKQYADFKKNIKELKKYYKKHATDRIPGDVKAVIYALHFEPEADIMNRTTYNSQIYNLMMLSKSLPKGWTIYVKEHPDTFRISKSNAYYMAISLSNYRNVKYYEEIIKISNVKLLNWRIRGNELLSKYKNQIKAVATINGTISFEAIELNVPLILFDPASIVCGNVEGVFSIRNYDDLVHMYNTISRPDYEQKYDGAWRTMSKFLFLHCDGKSQVPSDIYSSILTKYIENC